MQETAHMREQRRPRKISTGPIGLTLACAIIASWSALHVYGVFFFDLAAQPAWQAIVIMLALCWLYVGLFIVAHDCMHRSLAPGRPLLNRMVGQVCVALYAGFSYRELLANHLLHHQNAGTADDPDFAEPQPMGFMAWYFKFMSEYLNRRMMAVMFAQTMVYVFAFKAGPLNCLVFWVAPAILSSLQLFTFGTYLPHKPDAQGFADGHNARSNEYPAWLSLLTCFHFGYHHEHHLRPGEPWWRLPAVRRQSSAIPARSEAPGRTRSAAFR
jgi:beta-carotene/zeaxanthin 4-ketolase